jgi:hypothetical protein
MVHSNRLPWDTHTECQNGRNTLSGECAVAVGSSAGRQSDRLFRNTRTNCFQAVDPTVDTVHSVQQLYNFIVDFFEEPAEGSQAREQADALLSWWNQCVTSEIICISSSLMPFLDKSFLRTLPLPRPPGRRLLHGRHCGKNMLRWSFEFVCGVLIISVSLFQSNFFISYFFYWGARTHSNIKLHTTWGQPHMNGQGTMSRIGCHQSVYKV